MIKKALPGEFLHEAENTRKLLKMVPDSALSYHPQPQLWPVAKLASHIAEIYNWYSGIFNVDEFDFATYKYDKGDLTKAANIVEKIEANVADAKKYRPYGDFYTIIFIRVNRPPGGHRQ